VEPRRRRRPGLDLSRSALFSLPTFTGFGPYGNDLPGLELVPGWPLDKLLDGAAVSGFHRRGPGPLTRSRGYVEADGNIELAEKLGSRQLTSSDVAVMPIGHKQPSRHRGDARTRGGRRLIPARVETAERLTPEARNAAARALATNPADLQAIDVGGPARRFQASESLISRQLRRWIRQWHASNKRDLPLIDELAGQLAAQMPEERETVLVHGATGSTTRFSRKTPSSVPFWTASSATTGIRWPTSGS
jgi:phosphotransferase family enzyme